MDGYIVIADDDPDIRLLIGTCLELLGFGVDAHADGRGVVQALEAGARPDVVMLDVMMPGMDGWECLDALRSDGRYSQIPIVMFTSHVHEGQRERALARGATDFVAKPIDPASLDAVLAPLLEGSSQDRARAAAS